MTWQYGTVTVEATQLATDVRAVITDKFGVSKSIVFTEARVEDVPWEMFVDNHIRYSQWKTRRN